MLASAAVPASCPHPVLGAEAAIDALDAAGRPRWPPVEGRRRPTGPGRATCRRAWPTPTSPLEQRRLTDAIESTGLGGVRAAVVNDTFALLREGDPGQPPGVAVICGAGINGTGHAAPTDATARFAAVGHISGDWGGGGHLWAGGDVVGGPGGGRPRRGPPGCVEALPGGRPLPRWQALIEVVHLGGHPARALPPSSTRSCSRWPRPATTSPAPSCGARRRRWWPS